MKDYDYAITCGTGVAEITAQWERNILNGYEHYASVNVGEYTVIQYFRKVRL